MFIKPTKYFGNVEVKFDDNPKFGNGSAFFWITFNYDDISVAIFDYNSMGDKLALCWDIVDKFPNISKIAKKEIVKNYSEANSVVKKYFKFFFENKVKKHTLFDIFGYDETERMGIYYDDIVKLDMDELFKKLDIEVLAENLTCTDLDFYFEESILEFSVDYTFLENRFNDTPTLNITFNEKSEVIDFEINYELSNGVRPNIA